MKVIFRPQFWIDLEAGVARRYPRYLLFYRWNDETIEILRIKHGMMDLPRLFGAAPPTE